MKGDNRARVVLEEGKDGAGFGRDESWDDRKGEARGPKARHVLLKGATKDSPRMGA
jgi:hypothetical protein